MLDLALDVMHFLDKESAFKHDMMMEWEKKHKSQVTHIAGSVYRWKKKTWEVITAEIEGGRWDGELYLSIGTIDGAPRIEIEIHRNESTKTSANPLLEMERLLALIKTHNIVEPVPHVKKWPKLRWRIPEDITPDALGAFAKFIISIVRS